MSIKKIQCMQIGACAFARSAQKSAEPARISCHLKSDVTDLFNYFLPDHADVKLTFMICMQIVRQIV